MIETDEIAGKTRAYFYHRFVHAAREVIERGMIQEDRESEMVVKVNVQEAMDRLKVCPVCGSALRVFPDYPLERSCECGDFTITEVWSDGDVTFEFRMASPQKLEVDSIGMDEDGV